MARIGRARQESTNEGFRWEHALRKPQCFQSNHTVPARRHDFLSVPVVLHVLRQNHMDRLKNAMVVEIPENL